MFKEIRVYEETLRRGLEWSQYIQVTPRSFNNGQRIVVGTIGEAIFHQMLPGATYSAKNNWDYDFLFCDLRVDVKTSLVRRRPTSHYEVGVFKDPNKQNVDYFAYFALLNDFKTAWFLGAISREAFAGLCEYRPAGATRGDGKELLYEGWFVKAYQLEPLKFINYW